jgi:hypothetical protein
MLRRWLAKHDLPDAVADLLDALNARLATGTRRSARPT